MNISAEGTGQTHSFLCCEDEVSRYGWLMQRSLKKREMTGDLGMVDRPDVEALPVSLGPTWEKRRAVRLSYR